MISTALSSSAVPCIALVDDELNSTVGCFIRQGVIELLNEEIQITLIADNYKSTHPIITYQIVCNFIPISTW
jgi:hypothetical protein